MRNIVVILFAVLLLAAPVAIGQTVGANRTDAYLPLLKKKKVAIVANQTSVVFRSDTTYIHLLDTLLSRGVKVVKIFCPEHGFRGDVEAGGSVASGKDASSGLPIVSLYGKNKKPTPEQLKGLDYVIFDIQDVGCRFYTYISTLHYVMEACAENNVRVIVLDRPNPNGRYVDGPVLDLSLRSFVGMHPVPIVHGMTIGEYARMINGEHWIKSADTCMLTVIAMEGYDHSMRYSLPIPPSPNLRNDQAIALYPSLCLFEGTNVSVGRGTDHPFCIVGSPNFMPPAVAFAFKPKPIPGVSDNPLFNGKTCYGIDLSRVKAPDRFELKWLFELYRYSRHNDFFLSNGFFDKLSGTRLLRKQIEEGVSEDSIRASWEPALSEYKVMRQKYLLYQ